MDITVLKSVHRTFLRFCRLIAGVCCHYSPSLFDSASTGRGTSLASSFLCLNFVRSNSSFSTASATLLSQAELGFPLRSASGVCSASDNKIRASSEFRSQNIQARRTTNAMDLSSLSAAFLIKAKSSSGNSIANADLPVRSDCFLRFTNQTSILSASY
jgi:hypothetical protein